MTTTASRGSSTEAPARAKRADIQVLRGVAVLLVVLFHIRAPHMSGGFVGVDVFFVVSGFLVGGALASEAISSGRIDFAAFYARRARRILPAGMLTIGVVAIAVALTISPLRNLLWGRPFFEASLGKDALAATAYVPNLWFMREGNEYGATTSSSPYLHFWSLGVEEQFYIVAPFVIAILWFASRKRLAAFTITVSALGVLSVLYSLAVHATDGNIGYFDPLGRAWELVAGVLAALVATRLAARWTTRAATIATVSGFVGVGLSALLIDGERGWPRWTAVLVVAATALVLVAGSRSASFGVVARPLAWVGDRSYSWYLWHWPFLVIATAISDAPVRRLELGVVALVSLAVADQQYRWVERPAMRWPVRTRADRRKVWHRSTAFIALAVVAIGASSAWSHQRVASSGANLVAPPLADAEVVSVPDWSQPQAYVPADLGVPELEFATTVPFNIRPKLADAGTDVAAYFDDGCQVKSDQRLDPLPECSYGGGDTTIVLFGDSHAAHWYGALEPWIERGDVTVFPVTAAGCMPVPIPADTKRPGCTEWRSKALARIAQLKPDIVIVGARYQGVGNSESRGKQLARGMATVLPPLVANSRVYYIVDNPAMAQGAPACAAEHGLDVLRCGLPADEAISAVAERTAAQAAIEAGASYVNLNPYICNPDRCDVVLGDVMIYRDNDHLTQRFVATLWRPFGAAIGLTE